MLKFSPVDQSSFPERVSLGTSHVYMLNVISKYTTLLESSADVLVRVEWQAKLNVALVIAKANAWMLDEVGEILHEDSPFTLRGLLQTGG